MSVLAIGGGDKTTAMRIGLEYIEQSNTNTLIVPLACSTEASFNKKVPKCLDFFASLGVETNLLNDFDESPSAQKLADKFGDAAHVYVIGGNTPTLMARVEGLSMAGLFKRASGHGRLLSGTSAGAILPFMVGQSCPVTNPSEVEWDYKYIEGLGLINAALAVHANQSDLSPRGQRPESRLENFRATLPAEYAVGFAIDNEAALLVSEEGIRPITNRPDVSVHVLTGEFGQRRTSTLEPDQVISLDDFK